ncbi:hypothetical protein [Emticicia sp. 21SJ11W-3]|uniref:hypothetical protein n=1 Tax=Emticicia sp. 21SJ11W-3 TaxID=2916755 RepID=UPI00209EAC59|nr:hypothetical protein [Emticicia sp. 21SJ11W-3]UTA68818.1 hypothetical protein MB380_03210 [Emticicia sp. 21SJ11W-3]
MTHLKRNLKSSFWIAIVFYISSCNRSTEEKAYLVSADMQSTLDKTITSVLASVPYPDYVTVYFTESEAKKYIFVTPHRAIENIRSKYYFKKDDKLIIVAYKSEILEKTFANLESSKPERVFNFTNNKAEIYDGRRVVFEILNNNSIQEINPTEEILLLNNYGGVMFIPPNKKDADPK